MTQGPVNIATELAAGWRNRAACLGYPNSLFFPTPESPEASVQRAIEVCQICPVSEDCLQYALETNQRSGIWGGTTEDQRRTLRRKWLAARRRSA